MISALALWGQLCLTPEKAFFNFLECFCFAECYLSSVLLLERLRRKKSGRKGKDGLQNQIFHFKTGWLPLLVERHIDLARPHQVPVFLLGGASQHMSKTFRLGLVQGVLLSEGLHGY